MRIKRIEFEHFRSFGPNVQGIDLDPNLTFFVGKNNTGKSNLGKFLQELKFNRLPINRNYILPKVNWYNYEAGVDKPLKFKFIFSITEDEYQTMCDQLILRPLIEAIRSSTILDHSQKEQFPKNESDFSLTIWQPIFNTYLPKRQITLRMEFLRFSDTEQQTNYSLEFNEIIIISTADGRQFIQTVRMKDEIKLHEKETWDQQLLRLYTSPIIGATPSLKHSETLLIQLFENPQKYLYNPWIIEVFVDHFLDTLTFVNQNRIVELEPYALHAHDQNSLEENLMKKLYRVYKKALTELFDSPESHQPNYLLKPAVSEAWQKYVKLLDTFESLFDDIDITVGFVKEKEKFTTQFFQRSTNTPIYNFDSVGRGITEMLFFLYRLIIEEEGLLILEEPEAHLHPHHQRTLYNLMQENANHHQIIVVTHSGFFFQPDDLFALRIFDYNEKMTKILRLYPTLPPRDYDLLRKNFTVRNRDAIFADGIVFVEGVSEEWTFPYLFRMFGLDLDLNNLSLINIGGKGSFAAFLTFAQQLQKQYWFFFDYDVLGNKAGDEITPGTFKGSVIFKNKHLFPLDIRQLCESLVKDQFSDQIEFEDKLEYLRHVLQQEHIFIFTMDFEGVFEQTLAHRVQFIGKSKVEKAMQLLDFLKDSDEMLNSDQLFEFISVIIDEIKK